MWTRGHERRTIFFDDEDRSDFIRRLAVLPSAGMRCFAWALLSNHLHLVLQTGETPLSAVLKRVFTGFAIRFNRRHERTGYVFESRFGSRLVTGNEDLRVLVRYVHRNPVRAGLVNAAELEAYPWCGHSALAGVRPGFGFESLTDTLALFDEDPARARARMRAFVMQPESRLPQLTTPDRPGEEADLALLIRRVCERAGVAEDALLRGARERSVSRARSLVCYLAIGELGLSPRTVARALGITPGGVSQALRRGEAMARPPRAVTTSGRAARRN